MLIAGPHRRRRRRRPLTLREMDVLCGRGDQINMHHGNKKFRAICQRYKHAYQTIEGRGKDANKKKNFIAEKILKTELKGVRFLRLNEEGLYKLVPKSNILDKIKQYLRKKPKLKMDPVLEQIPDDIIDLATIFDVDSFINVAGPVGQPDQVG